MLAPAADRHVTRTDNHPPGPLDSGKEAMAELSAFLKDHPVIGSHAEAKQGGACVERTRIAINEIETTRDKQVRPLNVQVAKINADFKVVRDPLERGLKRLKQILTDFARAEENKRAAEAERLRLEADAAREVAFAAERAEQDSIARADVGECTDVGGAIAAADQAFNTFSRADRAAVVAERNTALRIGSVMGNRSIAMRSVEVLIVTDAAAAIKAMGLTDKIRDAILSSARDFRKAHGELPKGIASDYQRSL